MSDVYHREIGDIPGCTPAQDIFAAVPLEKAQMANMVRAAQFGRLVRAYVRGELDYSEVWRSPRLDPSLNAIKNPAKPYVKAW